MDIDSIISSLELEDFNVIPDEGGAFYNHKVLAIGVFISDETPGREDPDNLLAEIRASARRSLIAAAK